MPTASTISLQRPLDEFARSLTVPRRLLALHPRKRGHPGPAAALAPAITLSVISAFEGFVEEFVATAALSQGHGYAQIAKMIGGLNNPDIEKFQSLLVNQIKVPARGLGDDFEVVIWKPPLLGKGWWVEQVRDWGEAKRDASAWMEARHLLTHGITSGWQAENWPGSLKKDSTTPASSVLRETRSGMHSLAIHGAISCARIYVEASRYLAAKTAKHLDAEVDVSRLPLFPLYSEAAPIDTRKADAPTADDERREPAEAPDEASE